jgi:predicted DsbA family dithiol-disulfide isomerase
VPVFVVGGRHAISGAQPPEILVGLLDLAATASAASEPAAH